MFGCLAADLDSSSSKKKKAADLEACAVKKFACRTRLAESALHAGKANLGGLVQQAKEPKTLYLAPII
jgi:hypothetical protein